MVQNDSDVTIKEERKNLNNLHVKWYKRCEELLMPLIAQAKKDAGVDVEFVEVAEWTPNRDSDGGASITPGGTEVVAGRKRKRTGPQSGRQPTPPAGWSDVNALPVILPSMCVEEVRKQDCLQPLVKIEVEVRRNQAKNALDLLRTHLITSHAFREQIKKKVPQANTGHEIITRNKGAVMRKQANVNRAADMYRRAFVALEALGAADGVDFRKLSKEDVRPFVVRSEDQRLGDSKSQPSWIWQRLNFLNTKDVTENFNNYAQSGKLSIVSAYQ